MTIMQKTKKECQKSYVCFFCVWLQTAWNEPSGSIVPGFVRPDLIGQFDGILRAMVTVWPWNKVHVIIDLMKMFGNGLFWDGMWKKSYKSRSSQKSPPNPGLSLRFWVHRPEKSSVTLTRIPGLVASLLGLLSGVLWMTFCVLRWICAAFLSF